ncbi:hypothetical protein UP09_07585 [Bradyrhizobium sp. LTSP885]|uniref:ATP-binding protein n=1 Tax=Bradyrhizobium sp. LTSP885 TaxID=1619232 RepID=UPI0005CAACC0|nr:type IV secretory system conjugative DNA transfer family protein [Bradyrhizobium sp. LTSP885]KJC49087.1 hypothetical protein UP09_07585 [Bradyrhizobium sp. LTSP885]
MPAIIFLIVMVVLIIAATNWMGEHPGTFQLLLFVGYIAAAIWIFKRFAKSQWLTNYKRNVDNERAERVRKREADKLKKLEDARLAEWDTYTPPDRVQFLQDVTAHPYPAPQYVRESLAYICVRDKSYLQRFFAVEEYKSLYTAMIGVASRSLVRYTAALPAVYRQEPTNSPFTISLTPNEEELITAHQQLSQEFRNLDTRLFQSRYHYTNPLLRPTEPSMPSRKSWDETGKYYKEQMAEYKVELRTYERDRKEWEKMEDELDEAQTPTEKILTGSPLYGWANELIPNPFAISFQLPEAQRFAGTWIVAPPGRGKTNLLHNLIKEHRATSCTIVLMDSKGDLINFYKGYDNVVPINASTVQINPFQLGSSTRTLDFLEYIFSALLETKLTPKQTTLFRCCLALMLKIPNATIETFRKLLVHGWKDQEPYVMQLDEMNRDFFYVEGRKSEFDGGQYNETKQEVLQRLRLLVSNDYLKKIFTAPQSNTDFFALLDSGKTIIIDNSKDELGENGAEFFGRFFVAMVWMAAVSRSKLRQDQKMPVFFYIDECHTVIKRDTKITTILDECRSQKIALILAHQRIAQIDANVIDALNNCAIRMANSDDDAEALAKRFRVEAAALRLPVGQFSCFVRDKTPTAVTINVPEFDMSIFPPAPDTPPPYTPPPPPPRNDPPRSVPNDEVEDF